MKLKRSAWKRTRAKRNYVASDRARRENVPGHILFYLQKSFSGQKTFYYSERKGEKR